MNTMDNLKQAKPILFSTSMVQAILRDEKTQTRRIVEPQPRYQLIYQKNKNLWCEFSENPLADKLAQSPYGYCFESKYKTNDIIYVRETWQSTEYINNNKDEIGYIFKASPDAELFENSFENWKWRPSIFMPKQAARIFLKITNVRVERLQDISEADAIAEGITLKHISEGRVYYAIFKDKEYTTAKEAFRYLWDSLNKKSGYAWDSNPWVWVYEFERVKHNG